MGSAVLNCENMLDLPGIMVARTYRDVSRQLLSFALSSKTAFSSTANFVKKNLTIKFTEFAVYAISFNDKDDNMDDDMDDDEYLNLFYDSHFLRVFRKFISDVEIDYIPENESDLTTTLNSLKELRNMKSLSLHCTDHYGFDHFGAYNRVLKANTSYSSIIVNGLYFSCVNHFPTATQLPNLTALVVSGLLSQIPASKFTRSTFPVLEKLVFYETKLSKDGIRKLAKLFNVTHRTIHRADVFVSKSRINTMEKMISFRDLFCDHFKKLKFDKEFTLQIHVPVDELDSSVLQNAGFQWDVECWSSKNQFDDAKVVYDVFVD